MDLKNGNELEVLYQVAESMVCMKKFNYGAELYEKLINMVDGQGQLGFLAGIWHGYANCLEKLGNMDKAKIAYEKALDYHLKDLDNGDVSKRKKANLWGGWAAFKLGKIDMAYQLFKTSVLTDPGYAYSWLSLSMVCTKLGHKEEAIEAREKYGKMIRIEPYKRRECEGREMLFQARQKATGWLKEYIEKILPETECNE